MAIQDFFSYIPYAFYSRYSTVWLANMEIGLDPNNSIIKRLWCIWNMARIGFMVSEEMSFENIDNDGRTTDVLVYYKLTMS